jgi:hypothetical protein
MSSDSFKVISLEIPLYALPKDTDLSKLKLTVLNTMQELEKMGLFDQREFEPANIFLIKKETNNE